MLHLDIFLKNYWETQSDEFGYVKYEEHFTEEEPCNIYIIGIRPRVIIDPTSLNQNGRQIELKFKIQNKFEFDEITVIMDLNRDVIGQLLIESEEPYSRFNLKDDNGYFYDKSLYSTKVAIEGKSMYALRQTSHLSTEKFNDFEVLYIGKSLKMDKVTSPVKRLESHSKFQKILDKCTKKYFDKEVYIILCSFVYKINMVTMSENLRGVGSWETMKKRYRNDLIELNADRPFVTQVAEAMLIDYFDTREFNQDFIGSFGRSTHTYTSRIEKSKISKIILEVDLSKLCRIYSKTIPRKFQHFVEYKPTDNYKKEIHEIS